MSPQAKEEYFEVLYKRYKEASRVVEGRTVYLRRLTGLTSSLEESAINPNLFLLINHLRLLGDVWHQSMISLNIG